MSDRSDKATTDQPADKIVVDLAAIKDTDSPDAIQAVRALIAHLARQRGLSIGEPGQIDPAARENEQRAQSIVTAATKQMAREAEAGSQPLIQMEWKAGDKTTLELTGKDFSVRLEQVKGAQTRIKVDFQALLDMAESFTEGTQAVLVGIATKIGKWVATARKVKRRKRRR